MKVEVNEKEPSKKSKYPCLMKSETNGLVVLFSGKGIGTVISKGSDTGFKIGKYFEGFNMKVFHPFNGTITLQND